MKKWPLFHQRPLHKESCNNNIGLPPSFYALWFWAPSRTLMCNSQKKIMWLLLWRSLESTINYTIGIRFCTIKLHTARKSLTRISRNVFLSEVASKICLYKCFEIKNNFLLVMGSFYAFIRCRRTSRTFKRDSPNPRFASFSGVILVVYSLAVFILQYLHIKRYTFN